MQMVRPIAASYCFDPTARPRDAFRFWPFCFHVSDLFRSQWRFGRCRGILYVHREQKVSYKVLKRITLVTTPVLQPTDGDQHVVSIDPVRVVIVENGITLTAAFRV